VEEHTAVRQLLVSISSTPTRAGPAATPGADIVRHRCVRGWLVVPAVLLGLLTGGCGAVESAVSTTRYTVSAENMEPGLKIGQRITARKVARGDYRPERGDIVIFIGPDSWGTMAGGTFITRVVGLPSERLACCDASGRVTVNGEPLDEPYLAHNADLDGPSDSCDGRRFGPRTIPADHVFILGDNRTRSGDSRCAGTVPTEAVIAVVTA
jgi:signal peptidase I